MTESNYILLYVNNVLYLQTSDTSISTGQPGVGTVESSSVTEVDIGHQDTTPPIPVDPSTIKAYAQPNQVDLQWGATTDDPNGIGLLEYSIYRNGTWLANTPTTTTTFSDYTARPNTTYTYTIYAVDQHLNQAGTSYNVTTPPLTNVAPKTGVRPTGSYWGADGEQIDMASGNLNYTMPILKAMGRGGWSVNFQLSYNSQNWREDSGGIWQLGADTGYGYGWRLQAGSMTPVYSGAWTIDHYLFIDSTGGQHPFTVNNGNIWTSADGLYLSYDANANVLHFPDGSFWTFGSTSSGLEQDAGTMYPTLMEDSNGNEVIITYMAGAGSSQSNTSSRINTIEDVRGNSVADYTFTYNTDPIPHLTGITNSIGTSENYSFSYTENYSLLDPFSSQNYGSVTLLQSATVTAGPLTSYFTYDDTSPTVSCNSPGTGTSGPAELTQLTTPYCGHLRWTYTAYALSGTTLREVQNRYLSMSSGAAETEISLIRGNDSSYTVHSSATLDDLSANSEKYWTFQTDTTQFDAGLQLSYEERTLSTHTPLSHLDFTWAQTPTSLNPYIATTVTKLDPGQSYEADKETSQTLDQYGNMTQMLAYNFGNGSVGSLARTYTNTYLGGSAYTSRYIFNRLLTSTVTDGTNTGTLVSNSYDQVVSNTNSSATCNPAQQYTTSICEHDTTNYPYTFIYRGNVTTSWTPTAYTTSVPDMTGTVLSATVNGVTSNVAPTNNWAVPGQITTNTLTSTISYSSFLGPTSATGPNGDTGSIGYDAYGRVGATTSPYGAVTSYTYNDTASPPYRIATTNSHWVITEMDGFGRTYQTNVGYGSTNVSVTNTQYAPCGCSPLGKMNMQSEPYVPGNNVSWTTYAYDASGRTTSLTLPDGSATAYVYQGNTVKVTDPAGNWKTFTMDAFGNLTSVLEPDPSLGNVTTTYAYDVLNHLTTVSMPRGSNTQTRTFNYNSGTTVTGLLQSATNPENGTVTYAYNGNYLLAAKGDAKGQQLTYQYDAYNRLTSVTWANNPRGADVLRTYYYDTNPFDSSFSQNALGRLTAIEYPDPLNVFPGTDAIQLYDMYSYTQAGLPAVKRLSASESLYWQDSQGYGHNGIGGGNLDSTYTYNNEGKLTSITYPTTTNDSFLNCQSCQYNGTPNGVGTYPGASYNYSYDGMYRLSGMTDSNNNTIVSGVSYNAANQLLGMTFNSETESRTYNVLGQLTNITNSGYPNAENLTYAYPTGTNNGKISSMYNAVSGETVTYTYDSLNRLLTANGSGWGQQYGFDGFGNLLSKTVTAGSGPSLSQAVNAATNQIVGYNYDANGNQTGTPSGSVVSYDVENRVSGVGTYGSNGVLYAYDGQNRRIFSWTGAHDLYNQGNVDSYQLFLYTPTGQKLGTYQFNVYDYSAGNQTDYSVCSTLMTSDQYFGSRRLAVMDQLGSVGTFYPWGEAKDSTNPQDTWSYATYWRDSASGLDYAMNRYYTNAYGRFMTPDPYSNSGRLNDPQSWNRYAYTRGDPVNRFDPKGTDDGIPYDCYIDPDGMYDPACAPANCAVYGFVDVSCDNNGGTGDPCLDGDSSDPTCPGLPQLPVTQQYPTLNCNFGGVFTQNAKTGIVCNAQGQCAPSITDPISLFFNASGGDGIYSWTLSQTFTYYYSNSSGGTTVTLQGTGTETLNNTADDLFGPNAVFNDSPGPQFNANGLNTGTWVVFGYQLNTDLVTVSSGGQTVDCPPVTWLSMIWGSRQNNQLTYGGQATVIP